MKTVKIYMLVSLVFLLTFSIVFNGQVEAKEYKILFVAPKVNDPVWLKAKEGFDDAADEFGFKGVWTGANDHTVQGTFEALETAISSSPDGIVTCPFSPSAFTEVLNNAKEAGIPISTVAVDALNKDNRVSFIGTNFTNAGVQLGKALYEKAGNNLKIGVIMSNLDAANQIAILEAMKKYFEDNNIDYEIVDKRADQADPIEAAQILSNMILAHPEMNVVAEIESGGVTGTATVLEEKGLSEKITLIGFDDTEPNLAAVRGGHIYGLMAQDFYEMGYKGGKFVFQSLNGQEVPNEIDSGVSLVTLENIDNYNK